MIDRGEIDAYIALHERRGVSWRNLEALSVLYTVRDHLQGDFGEAEPERLVPAASEAIRGLAEAEVGQEGSEFVKAASAVTTEALMGIMDEHMRAVMAVFPKEYDRVMRQLRSLA